MPAAPSQADHGAQTYWLLCLACHGDRGQGLTEEFRETYPPEEQYCWERGCHGERPYDFGFKLPMQIPAVVGPEAALGKFTTAARLNAYIMAAMPYWKPGSLTEEEGWLVTAFLLRENGVQFSEELYASNAEEILLSELQLFPTPVPETSSENVTQQTGSINSQWLLALAVVVIIIVVAAASLLRRSIE